MIDYCEKMLTDVSEYVFGHVDTPEEKMAAARKDMETVVDEAQDQVGSYSLDIKRAQKKQREAERRDDEHALREATKRLVLTQKKQRLAQGRADGYRQQLQQTQGLEHNQRMLHARMRVIAQVNQGQALPNQPQLEQMLYKLTSDADRASVVNDLVNDALETVAEGQQADEEQLSAEDEEEIERQVQQSLIQRSQRKYDALPKPRGTAQISAHVLVSESQVEMTLKNREGQRRIEQYLAGTGGGVNM